MIIVLTITTFVLALFLMSAIIHIIKIQKELKTIFQIEQEQDELLGMIVEHNKNMASAVKDLQDYVFEQPTTIYPFGRIMGEA
jgi:hypothetical protein